MTARSQPMIEHDADDYAYRFQYADGSAFVVLSDGRAFLTFPEKDGRRRPPEQKFGQIDNRIPLLIGKVAKPRQDEIDRLRAELASARKALRTVQQMIKGEIVENAVVDVKTKHTLGDIVSAALKDQPK